MVDGVFMIIDFMKDVFGLLHVNVGGGIYLDVLILCLIIVSMFASIWFKGANG